MNFEEGMKELEQIISKLESGNIKFDEATNLFERGADICKNLNNELKQTNGRVTVIRQELGAILEEDLK